MSEETKHLISVIFLAILFAVLGVLSGQDSGQLKMKREAVLRGYAHWAVKENGSPKFEWGNAK